jgi:hypothetical protein
MKVEWTPNHDRGKGCGRVYFAKHGWLYVLRITFKELHGAILITWPALASEARD